MTDKIVIQVNRPSASAVATISENAGNIEAVAGSIGQVQAVGDDLSGANHIGVVSADLTGENAIGALGQRTTEIDAIYTELTDIVTVSDNIEDVADVAAMSPDVIRVGGAIDDGTLGTTAAGISVALGGFDSLGAAESVTAAEAESFSTQKGVAISVENAGARSFTRSNVVLHPDGDYAFRDALGNVFRESVAGQPVDPIQREIFAATSAVGVRDALELSPSRVSYTTAGPHALRTDKRLPAVHYGAFTGTVQIDVTAHEPQGVYVFGTQPSCSIELDCGPKAFFEGFDVPPGNITTRTVTIPPSSIAIMIPFAGDRINLAVINGGQTESVFTNPDRRYTITRAPNGTYIVDFLWEATINGGLETSAPQVIGYDLSDAIVESIELQPNGGTLPTRDEWPVIEDMGTAHGCTSDAHFRIKNNSTSAVSNIFIKFSNVTKA